ncbi:class II fructose-bisphosphatase [Alphaproteobacteria bacterium]|nr:class II fructose-bisphosphatase [Alphaproteobacteria bacterium]MDB4234035.1 class II fructose-bisphosphatase [Alphaproteobacteria bacterium]MDB9825370.1 class II fructose-bisphosphatase [Alphaproteobacteria bacterium]
MDRNLAIELVRVTEFAALAAAKHIGRGDEKIADQAAVDAMRTSLNAMTIDGTVVIGEGERDEAPMLYIGEKVGQGGPKVDIALDPLEGTTITAKGGENAMAVIALAQDGGFLNAPDVYMEKISSNIKNNENIISIQQDLKSNIKDLAKYKNINVEDMIICVLDRERHQNAIEEIRSLGSRIKMIDDGDVSAVISSALPNNIIDMYYGIGGAPEGVLAAAALQCIGGFMEGKLLFRNDDEKARAAKVNIKDLNKIYSLKELAQGDVMFSATGVTDGTMLPGVKTNKFMGETHSIVMRSKTGTVRHIVGNHNFNIKKLEY